MKKNISKRLSVISNELKTLYSLLTTRHFNVKPRRGFTLIETLVATSVLLISLAGPLSIASQALQSAYYARDQITAFYLDQEAVEYVRAVRDQNYLAEPALPWLTGLEVCIDDECAVDFQNFSNQTCGNSACPFLLLGQTNGLFNLSSGNPTIYRRTLTINTVAGSPDEVTVRVMVEWQSSRRDRSFEITEQLFDWL